jgi:hypothetical protein
MPAGKYNHEKSFLIRIPEIKFKPRLPAMHHPHRRDFVSPDCRPMDGKALAQEYRLREIGDVSL